MGTSQPSGSVLRRRAARAVVAGALPLSLVLLGVTPALAEDAPPAVTTQPADIPDSAIHIGTLQLDRPIFLTPEQTAQINTGTIGAETALAQSLEAAGLDHARATSVSKAVLGDAAIGAGVGATLASPIAWAGAVIGVVSGLIAGLPFAPIGLVIVPVIGAALGYAMVAAPFAALGAGVGAAVGVADGLLNPAPATQPAQAPAPAAGATQPGPADGTQVG
ncbi:hypothetical protein [Nocardia niigatensis]